MIPHANEKPLEGDITPITTSELAAATTTSPPDELGREELEARSAVTASVTVDRLVF